MIPNSNPQATAVPLSPEELAKISARHAAAEGGHWHLDPEPHTDPDLVRTRVSGWLRYIGVLRFDGHLAAENRQFILYAHDDVRLLLAEVERLATRVAELEQAAQTRHCGRAMVHPDHRWMSARESVQCPGTEAGA